MDGDFGPYDLIEVRLRAADAVVFLDFSSLRCAWRAIRRSRDRADFWRWLLTYRLTYRWPMPVRAVMNEGMAPAAVADLVADAIAADRFWVFTDPHFTEMALDRWQRIAEGQNPQAELDLPGFPPAKEFTAEIRRLLTGQ